MADEDRAESETWGALGFAEEAAVFESASQNARVLSEGWVAANLFCPNCGEARLHQFANNRPAADFACLACSEVYELKAKKGPHGRKVLDGEYRTMLGRLAQADSPNLLLMSYGQTGVTDLTAVPRWFFTPTVIEPKKPLGPTARRAGWQGCFIVVGDIPETGRVGLVRERRQTPKPDVLRAWDRTRFLQGREAAARGWLADVLRCVEEIGRPEFYIADVYAFEARLARLYPGNNNVRPKIRQQLQVLRDAGVLAFVPGERGRYRLLTA
jgi:type II restriction enzyme